MPRIENDIKLDFKDVLIRPKRSTLSSRSQVSLESISSPKIIGDLSYQQEIEMEINKVEIPIIAITIKTSNILKPRGGDISIYSLTTNFFVSTIRYYFEALTQICS